MKNIKQSSLSRSLPKSRTGIQGLDEITNGGFPKGRPTLVCGGAGCGKTLLATEFVVNGAVHFNEPGVIVLFEETSKELKDNVASLGFNLEDLEAKKMLVIDHIMVERDEIEETGEYDLGGLFVRLNYAIDSIGAKRIMLDSMESLFSSLPSPGVLRAELRRLFKWLKDKGVTAVVTAERGNETLTREGLEEYISDCVILLDHRVNNQSSTRRMRIVKYRGSIHGTNEFPFLIDETGLSILPISSLGLDHKASTETVSSGIPGLDRMLGKNGFYRGSSILVSGTAGTGKTSLATHFAQAACKRGEKVLFFSLEESSSQIIRNMKSIGIDLSTWNKKGLLRFYSVRPTSYGLEMHLDLIIKAIKDFKPKIVIIDHINSFITQNNEVEAKAMTIRLIDFVKSNNITAFFTTLSNNTTVLETTDIMISSMIDAWILVRDIEIGGERNRGIFILKARGMSHSNQVREFILTDKGILLRDVYAGMVGVLTGSARMEQEAKDSMEKLLKEQAIESKQMNLHRQRKLLEARIAAIRAEFEAQEAENLAALEFEKIQRVQNTEELREMALSRLNNKNDHKKRKK